MASSLRADEEITEIYYRHVDTVYRICFSYMKNAADTEDMVQETFLKLMTHGQQFQSVNHEKAWLIVTAANTCKDELRRWKRRLEHLNSQTAPEHITLDPHDTMLDAILALPAKYKDVVYLHYYEGYLTAEIASMLHRPESTVRNQLSRARKMLKKAHGIGGDDNHVDRRNL